MGKVPAWVLAKAHIVLCGCGCTTAMLSLDNNGRPRQYLRGHVSRVYNPGLAVMVAQAHERSKNKEVSSVRSN